MTTTEMFHIAVNKVKIAALQERARTMRTVLEVIMATFIEENITPRFLNYCMGLLKDLLIKLNVKLFLRPISESAITQFVKKDRTKTQENFQVITRFRKSLIMTRFFY